MACFQDFSIAYYEFVNLCKSILYKYLRITTKHSLRQKIYNKSSFFKSQSLRQSLQGLHAVSVAFCFFCQSGKLVPEHFMRHLHYALH